jgi:hypothetical protein
MLVGGMLFDDELLLPELLFIIKQHSTNQHSTFGLTTTFNIWIQQQGISTTGIIEISWQGIITTGIIEISWQRHLYTGIIEISGQRHLYRHLRDFWTRHLYRLCFYRPQQ